MRPPGRAELRPILKIGTPSSIILGLIWALSIPVPTQRDGEPEIRVAELELIGLLTKNHDGSIRSFLPCVFGYSSLGEAVDTATADELRRADMWSDQQAVSIGSLTQDRSIPATVQVDELVGKHRAILVAPAQESPAASRRCCAPFSCRKTRRTCFCGTPHGEYTRFFGQNVEVITPDDLQLLF